MGETDRRSVRAAYEQFLAGRRPSPGTVREVVVASWMRARRRGLDPSATARDPGPEDFPAYRDAHPMSRIRPLVHAMVLDDISDAGGVVALSDHTGRLLWVDGPAATRTRAERIGFAPGTVWSEDTVGTNAPGLALALERGVQVVGPEHFAGHVQEWSCAAAPVHDPRDGRLIGVLDVTGGGEVATPFALATVRSVVAAIEQELRAHAVDLTEATATSTPPVRLRVLDAQPTWYADGDVTPGRPLSRRHAEILVLLESHPDGFNTEQLALLLAEDGLDSVTVRAEISRLRREIGTAAVASRPYRLDVPVTSDLTDVRELIARGDLRGAIAALGRGGLLAESTAPGIVELFEELREDLRSRVLGSREISALAAWTESAHGRDDVLAWAQLTAGLDPSDPARAIAAGRVRLLDRRFGR